MALTKSDFPFQQNQVLQILLAGGGGNSTNLHLHSATIKKKLSLMTYSKVAKFNLYGTSQTSWVPSGPETPGTWMFVSLGQKSEKKKSPCHYEFLNLGNLFVYNYKSLSGMFRPFWVGFLYLTTFLGDPGGLVAINCLAKCFRLIRSSFFVLPISNQKTYQVGHLETQLFCTVGEGWCSTIPGTIPRYDTRKICFISDS